MNAPTFAQWRALWKPFWRLRLSVGNARWLAGNQLRLLSYALPHWPTLVMLGVATGVTSLLTTLQPWPIKLLIDSVLGGTAPPEAVEKGLAGLGVAQTAEVILVLAVAGELLLFALNSALEAVTNLGWTVVGRRMIYGLAGDVFARLQRRSLTWHGRARTGEMMTRVTNDTWVVQDLLNNLVFAPAQAVLTITFTVFLMSRLDSRLMVATLIGAPAIVATSRFFGGRVRALAETQRSLQGDMRAHLQQTLTGIPVVQAFAQERREEMCFRRYADVMIRAQQRGALIRSLNAFGTGLVAALGSAVVLGIGALRVLDGAMTIGTLLVFMAYLRSLQGQIGTLAGIYPTLQRVYPVIDRLNEVLCTPAEVADRTDSEDIMSVRGEIAFQGVSFAYELGRPVLQDLSFRVDAGQMLAIVGPTGAGKSTLVSLIPRFFDPSEGQVLIDGHDLRDIRLASLRRQIALVLQEPFLFPLSIAENIAYGRPDASRDEIEEAARAANAHEFVSRLPQGYDTVLGERAVNLSGGERQRIAIARALLKNAPILILDEPTSAVDVGTEALILDAIRRLIHGRTTFLIAHRLSTVRDADLVAVLDHGRLVEICRPMDLLRRETQFPGFQHLLPEIARGRAP